MKEEIRIQQLPDPWKKLPELAERLGVKEGESLGSIDITLVDGRKYSAFALIAAFLDRLDEVEKKLTSNP